MGTSSLRRFATILLLTLSGILLPSVVRCRAETPLISVVISADGDTTYGKLLPVIQEINKVGLDVIFRRREKPGVSVVIQIRSDAKVVARMEIRKELRERPIGAPRVTYLGKEGIDRIRTSLISAGADEVSVATIHILPSSDFSLTKLSELRRRKRRVLVICHAKWSVPSQRLERQILLNKEVISAAKKSNVVIMLVDMTDPLEAADTAFFKKYRIGPLSFSLFAPDQELPRVFDRLLSRTDFIELLESENE